MLNKFHARTKTLDLNTGFVGNKIKLNQRKTSSGKFRICFDPSVKCAENKVEESVVLNMKSICFSSQMSKESFANNKNE